MMKTSKRFITNLYREAAGIALLALVWCLFAWLYPAYIIPTPWSVFSNIPAYLPADFWHHAGLTLYRTVAGFGLSMLLGTLIGIIAYAKKWVQPVNSLMLALQVLPGTILGVIFLLMFGIGNTAPIMLVTCLTLPTLAINTIHGLSKKNVKLEAYLKSIHSNRLGIIRHLYLPVLIPVFQGNLSLGMGLAVKIVVMGEFIGAQDGIGYLLNTARIVFNMKEVFFYLVVLLLFTLVFQALQTWFFAQCFKKYEYAE